MIYLYQFPPVWGLLNASPFCMKLEVYLRLAKLPYQVKRVTNPRYAPKGKLPYIKDDDKVISDSGLIIDYLTTRYGDILDKELTSAQKAQNTALQRMLEEHLYWVIVYSRWADSPLEWHKLKKVYFSVLPWMSREIIAELVRRNVKKALYEQGIGRHTPSEIYHLGKQDITALAALLNSQPFFCGDKPTGIDAVSYAFLANILFSPIESPLKEYTQSIPEFSAYCERMKKYL